jgi:AmmeMemoRadiSam system protein B
MLPAPDTVVVAGGHLGPSDPVMIAPEDQLSTPLGLLTVDRELSDRLKRALRAIDDRHPDNTVEIQLPFVAYLFPSASVVYVRVPPSPDAIHLGETLAQYARSTGRQIRVIGSTDLTHYGPNYGFVEHGRGAKAVEWVRDANDAPLIETMLSMNDVGAISQALRDRSACSPGAAATAIAFARESGCVRGEEVDYYTSYSIQPAESFVGYAGIGFAA